MPAQVIGEAANDLLNAWVIPQGSESRVRLDRCGIAQAHSSMIDMYFLGSFYARNRELEKTLATLQKAVRI